MSESHATPFPRAHAIAKWLWVVCALIVAMVAVGGITRLTESGLSMANWRPILGSVPPLNEGQWEEAFSLYREKMTAQYEKFSADGDMTLAHFKEIYLWEYLHRLLGRLIGLAYAVPMVWFFVRGGVPGRWKLRLTGGLVLGGLQGVLGWYMVMSGFSNLTTVSHFRLAAHLGLALFVFGYLLWMIFDLRPYWTHRDTNYHKMGGLRRGSLVLLGLLVVQIVYGAFTAGLRAGYMYPSYPKMGRGWVPPNLISEGFGSVPGNLLSNPVAVQFIHRHLGLAVFFGVLALWGFAQRQRLIARQALGFNVLLILVTLQFFLGVTTLTSGMNLVLAVAHQVCACLLLGSLLWMVHALKAPALH